MSSFQKAINIIKFDKRLIEWNLRNGYLNEAEYEEYLKKLPDLSASTQKVDFEDQDDIENDDDEI